MRRPGRTPAPCTPASRRDRIGVVAGSADRSSRSVVSIHEIGKRVEGAVFPISGEFRSLLRCFGSLDARTPVPAAGCDHKNRYNSMAF
jgi:hypothetical protein